MLAVQFAVHLPARRMLLGYVTAFVVAAVLTAWAPNGPVFAVAFIVEGLCTSLMLIAAASLAPLLAGVAMIVALVIHQYRGRRPLMPVRQLATTFPVCGILVAMCASAAAFGLTELILTVLQGKSSPGHIALLFLPEFGAAVLTAVLFGALFRTRFTALLPIGGLLGLACTVHHRVLAPFGADPACLRTGRVAARRHRVPGRADPAVPDRRDRD